MVASAENEVPLWVHDDPQRTKLWEFKTGVENKYGQRFDDYEALRRWSIANINDFWTEVWHFTGIVSSKPFAKVGRHTFGPGMNVPWLKASTGYRR
jgi:hypothetical protein